MTKKAKTFLAFHLHEGDAVHCCLLGFPFCLFNFCSMANSLLEPHLSKTSKQKARGFYNMDFHLGRGRRRQGASNELLHTVAMWCEKK